MTSKAARKNPHRPGDVVTMVNANGSGQGILWKVLAVTGTKVRLSVCLCITGPSTLRDKTVMWHQVEPVDLVTLCSSRAQLDIVINDIVRNRGPEVGTDR